LVRRDNRAGLADGGGVAGVDGAGVGAEAAGAVLAAATAAAESVNAVLVVTADADPGPLLVTVRVSV